MTLELLPLGVGSGSSEVYYQSSFVIVADGKCTLVDCPSPLRKMLYDARQQTGMRISSGELDDIIITHVHMDHCAGLSDHLFNQFFSRYWTVDNYMEKKRQYKEALEGREENFSIAGYGSALQDMGEIGNGEKEKIKTSPGQMSRPNVYSHRLVHRGVWSVLEEPMGMLANPETLERHKLEAEDYYNPIGLDGESPNKVNNLEVEVVLTIHHIPTTALRFHYDGRCFLSYSSDTNFNPGLIRWLAEADTIIHETNLGIHTPYEKLLTLPKEIKDKMYLIHYPDSFDTKRSEIRCLEQGKVYVL